MLSELVRGEGAQEVQVRNERGKYTGFEEITLTFPLLGGANKKKCFVVRQKKPRGE